MEPNPVRSIGVPADTHTLLPSTAPPAGALPERDRCSALTGVDTKPLDQFKGLTERLFNEEKGDLAKHGRERVCPTEAKATEKSEFHNFKLRSALDEVVNTEAEYLDNLSNMVRVYRDPLLERRIIREEEAVVLFSNIDTIMQMNKGLLTALQNSKTSVCDAFTQWTPTLKVYAPYIENFDAAQRLREDLSQKNKKCHIIFAKFRAFLEETSSSHGQSLQSYHIMPVQRLAKYPLLVREVLKYTPKDQVDREGLVRALEGITTMVEFIDNRKAKFDAFTRIRQVEGEGRAVGFTASDRNLVSQFIGSMLKDKLYVRVVHAKLDEALKAPWVELQLSNNKVNTQPARSGHAPAWKEDFVFPIYRRNTSQQLTKTLILSIWDMKRRGEGAVGVARLNVEELRQNFTEKFGETPHPVSLHPLGEAGPANGQLFVQISYTHDAVVDFNSRKSGDAPGHRRDRLKNNAARRLSVGPSIFVSTVREGGDDPSMVSLTSSGTSFGGLLVRKSAKSPKGDRNRKNERERAIRRKSVSPGRRRDKSATQASFIASTGALPVVTVSKINEARGGLRPCEHARVNPLGDQEEGGRGDAPKKGGLLQAKKSKKGTRRSRSLTSR